ARTITDVPANVNKQWRRGYANRRRRCRMRAPQRRARIAVRIQANPDRKPSKEDVDGKEKRAKMCGSLRRNDSGRRAEGKSKTSPRGVDESENRAIMGGSLQPKAPRGGKLKRSQKPLHEVLTK